MSRIGKAPISVPKGVEITVNNFGSSSANTVVDYNSGSSSLPSCGGSSWTLSYNSIINTFEIN